MTQVDPVTAPTPLSILRDVAPVVDQESMVGTPLATVDWLAVKLEMVGRGPSVTVAVPE
jgi:hypothetical protein